MLLFGPYHNFLEDTCADPEEDIADANCVHHSVAIHIRVSDTQKFGCELSSLIPELLMQVLFTTQTKDTYKYKDTMKKTQVKILE